MGTFTFAGEFCTFDPTFLCVYSYSKHSSLLYFISDARNMARDVHNILLKVVMEKGNMTELQAADYIKRMDSQKRYSSDVWSWIAKFQETEKRQKVFDMLKYKKGLYRYNFRECLKKDITPRNFSFLYKYIYKYTSCLYLRINTSICINF